MCRNSLISIIIKSFALMSDLTFGSCIKLDNYKFLYKKKQLQYWCNDYRDTKKLLVNT